MWDLIVSIPDHCLSFYFSDIIFEILSLSNVSLTKFPIDIVSDLTENLKF